MSQDQLHTRGRRERLESETFDVVVTDVHTEAEGVVSLSLARPEGGALAHWEPGAHVTLHLGNGMDRDYSLCGPADNADVWAVAVLLEPASRGGSEYVHEKLAAGSRLSVTGPRNGFPLTSADEHLLVAGGIGITPILAMARQLQREGASWRLLYGGRARSSMAFVAELESLGGQVLVRPQEEFGLLDLGDFLGEPRPNTAIYCCGPEPLLAAIEEQCSSWPEGALRLERFRAQADELSMAGDAFEIELADSGRTLMVDGGRSIIDVLEEAGISVLTSCREGTCGTCETGVIEGLPDHRDSFLTEEEKADNSTMMICTSRSLSPRLVLEL